MSTEIQKTIEDLGRAFEQFKSANDQQIKEKAKGVFEPILEEKTQRLGNAMADLEAKLAKLGQETKDLSDAFVKSQRTGSGGGEADPAKRDHTKAFLSFIRNGREEGLRDLERKAMSVGSDPNGGYFAPIDMSGRIVTKVFETTPMRQFAFVDTTTSDTYEGITDRDEVSSGWVGETTTRSETDTPEVGKYSIKIGELYAEPRITQKLLEDADRDVEAWLVGKISEKFARDQNNAFLNGNGVNKPRGLCTYTTAATADSSRSWGVIEHIASGGSGAFTATTPQDKLVEMTEALKPAYRNGARWMMPRAVSLLIRKFKTATDLNYIWQPSLVAGAPATLLGYPVEMAEDFPAIASNSLSAAFGNFGAAYTIVDRRGIAMMRDPYTAKPYVKFYTTMRVGGAVTDFEAVKLLKFANS
jgi:HK97 family phage major capsid protein